MFVPSSGDRLVGGVAWGLLLPQPWTTGKDEDTPTPHTLFRVFSPSTYHTVWYTLFHTNDTDDGTASQIGPARQYRVEEWFHSSFAPQHARPFAALSDISKNGFRVFILVSAHAGVQYNNAHPPFMSPHLPYSSIQHEERGRCNTISCSPSLSYYIYDTTPAVDHQ